jgi:hypothetical protein
MDSATFYLVIIILLAVILGAVGIYLILVLHEFRRSLKRFNGILDHVDSLLEILDSRIARPANSILGAVGAIKEIVDLLKEVRGHSKNGS